MMSYRQINILYYFPEKENIIDKWQQYHIFDELSHYNITFEIFNPFHYENLENAWESLIQKVKNNHQKYTLFFTGIGKNYISSEVINEIKKTGLPTLLLCFDNLHAPFMHKDIACLFDLVWLTSYETESMFKKWGAKTCFLPYAANPFFFHPNIKEEINTIGFIGTPYGTRIKKINYLTENNIPVSVYSDFLTSNNQTVWKPPVNKNISSKIWDIYEQLSFTIGRKIFYSEMKKKFLTTNKQFLLNKNEDLSIYPSVSYEEMNQLFSTFAISLNITDIWNTYLLKKPVFKIHLRTFEIPMSGGLQITNYTEEIATYFKENHEIILYKTEEELISKTKFYLRDENQSIRKNIKLAARKRAEKDHTWYNRFNNIFTQIGI